MISRRWIGTLGLSLIATPGGVHAQGGTDIFVAPLRQDGRSITIGTPVNVTHRAGYDNQPSFTPDGASLLYTAIGADGQADTWTIRLTGRSSEPSRLTNTAIGVYSPTVMPDGKSFSVIRVERDSTQRLWKLRPRSGRRSGGSMLRLDPLRAAVSIAPYPHLPPSRARTRSPTSTAAG